MEINPWSILRGSARRAYIGCRTTLARNAKGKAIEVYDWLPDGTWQHIHSASAGENPSYLAIDPNSQFLHAVHGDGCTVSSFAMEADGSLQLLGIQPTLGINPVHLCFSPCGNWMLIANYASGSVVSLPVNNNGSLGQVAFRLQLPDTPGPHRTQQCGAHPHQVVFDPTGKWLLVPDKGGDAIHSVVLDTSTGSLQLHSSLAAPTGSGPRHLTFDTSGKNAWAVLELSSQVMAMQFDSETGRFRPVQRISSVPTSFTGDNTGAGILISPHGDELCVSNRGHGSVCIYAIDPDTAVLSCSRWISTGGCTPRFICSDNEHSKPWMMLIANEDVHNIVYITVDEATAQCYELAKTGSPVCVVIAHQSL